MPTSDENELLAVLSGINDPEIPFVSIVDLGMVDDLTMAEHDIKVSLMPTFIGCPAQGIIRDQVLAQLRARWPGYHIQVSFEVRQPWSTDRITERGREALKRRGIAPPGKNLDDVCCPFCGESHAILENMFGATSCRSLYYCSQCRNPFEAFKPL